MLFNPKSQRLDFTKVAKLFGISERRLAAIIGVLPTTANKTPDSTAVHEKLLPFERIACGLSEMEHDEDTFRRRLVFGNALRPPLSSTVSPTHSCRTFAMPQICLDHRSPRITRFLHGDSREQIDGKRRTGKRGSVCF
jgi:hypothetical protein